MLPNDAIGAIIEPSRLDKSIEYLTNIFGNKINKYFLSQNYNSNSWFLANLFELFNSLILIISVIILSYVTVLSAVNTAQEGQVMGKKWSSVWIPLRSAIGLLLLSPIPGSGYSLLQVIIMWVVLNGVGAADRLWDFVLNNLSQGVSISKQEFIKRENVNIIHQQAVELATNLINPLACINIINKNLNAMPGNPGAGNQLSYQIGEFSVETATELSTPIIFGIPGDDLNKKNLCGELQISSVLNVDELTEDPALLISAAEQDQILKKIHKIKLDAVVAMLQKINNLISAVIDLATVKASGEIILPDDLSEPGILYDVIQEYQQSLMKLTKQEARSWINLKSSLDPQAISEKIINQGKDFGWITAGSYYYLLTQNPVKNLLSTVNNSYVVINQLFKYKTIADERLNAAALNVVRTSIQPYVDAFADQEDYIKNLFKEPKELLISKNISNNINKVNQNRSKQLNQWTQALPKELKLDLSNFNLWSLKKDLEFKHPVIKPYMDYFFILYDNIIREIEYCFTSHTDPLVSQAIFGTKLMQAAETFWSGITVGSLVSEGFANIFKDNANGSSMGFIITLLPVTLILSGIVWTIGATLSVYTPMIPYMIFIITALSWFMLVVEAVLAAPIVALGFIAPSQDELGKVAPALGITANMFLKPILMIFGLLMSAKIYSSLINMINIGFKFSFATLQFHAGSSMFGWIVIIILYSAFILTLVNKCYSLIYQLPDKILRWIGLTAEQTDIGSIKETQHMFEQGAKQGIAPIEGAATSAAKKIKAQIEAAKNSEVLNRHIQATARDGSEI